MTDTEWEIPGLQVQSLPPSTEPIGTPFIKNENVVVFPHVEFSTAKVTWRMSQASP